MLNPNRHLTLPPTWLYLELAALKATRNTFSMAEQKIAPVDVVSEEELAKRKKKIEDAFALFDPEECGVQPTVSGPMPPEGHQGRHDRDELFSSEQLYRICEPHYFHNIRLQ